jgi:CheY-like chemotaxis protein
MAKILVVDDFEDSRFSLARLLELSGHTVIEAADGRAAVDLTADERPDIVLMDLTLPILDGVEATAKIRAAEAHAEVPIVALSAHDSEAHRTRALGAGCNAYVTKPVDFEALERLLTDVLAESETPRDA